MKFPILLICALPLLFDRLLAQPKDLSDTAFSAYHNGHYSQAIALYKQLIKSEEKLRYRSQHASLMLSKCYTNLDSIEQAKDILVKIVFLLNPDPKSLDLPLQEDARQNLADIYFKEKNFKKALECYSMHDAKWASSHFADINRFEYNYYRAISMSKCFEGMRLRDSAITVLTPYIFSSYRQLGYLFKFFREPNNPKDSLKHDSVCMRYLHLLKQKYSVKSIKAELKSIKKTFNYSQTIEPSPKDSTFYWLTVRGKFYFYGLEIPYMEYSVGDKKDKLIVFSKQAVFTREYQLAHFLNLPLCKMIQALP